MKEYDTIPLITKAQDILSEIILDNPWANERKWFSNLCSARDNLKNAEKNYRNGK